MNEFLIVNFPLKRNKTGRNNSSEYFQKFFKFCLKPFIYVNFNFAAKDKTL